MTFRLTSSESLDDFMIPFFFRSHCSMLRILVCLALFVAAGGEDIDLDLTVDRTNWIDPNDPFTSASYCTKSTLDQLSLCKMGLEECLKDTKACFFLLFFPFLCFFFFSVFFFFPVFSVCNLDLHNDLVVCGTFSHFERVP